MSVFQHAVVVATTGSRASLLRRALESLRQQRRRPERIVVVLDESLHGDASHALLERIRGVFPEVDSLLNRRTPGASGAWNTAIDHLLRTTERPHEVLVSFLDDDDTWEAGYAVEVCRTQHSTGAEVIAATLVRHDRETPDGRAMSLPERLDASAFFVGNPGLQPTNISVRLSTLLEAGMFDEALPSCTDRDLCIRLADLGVTYATCPLAIAHHDTLHGQARLSDPQSLARRGGLEAFFAKYRFRMSATEVAAFLQRAQRLFGWVPSPVEWAPPAAASEHGELKVVPMRIVVGIIVDGGRPERALPLLRDLARLGAHRWVDGLDVVLLENGDHPGFGRIVGEAESMALSVWPVDLHAQCGAAPELGIRDSELELHKTIAVARTLLQRFVHVTARAREAAFAWILDDDGRLPEDLDAFLSKTEEARQRGNAVVIGGTTGAPALPSAATLRVQLVDAVHFLAGAARRGPEETPPDPRMNSRWTQDRRDYYYDLARDETDRLEVPFVPATGAMTLLGAVHTLAERLARILAGELVTRSVVQDETLLWKTSHLRGGNTMVFDVDLLRDVPNLAPRIDGRCVRRSDMLFALHVERRCGKSIVAAPLPVFHDRSHEPAVPESPQKLVEDIVGYAFFRAYGEALPKDAPLGAEASEAVRAGCRKLAAERVAAFRLSFWRGRGLARALRALRAQPSWWANDTSISAPLDAFLRSLDEALVETRLDAIERGVREGVEKLKIDEYLSSAESIGAEVPSVANIEAWAADERTRRCRTALEGTDVHVDERLGLGSEGVVFRAGNRVFKVFDGWSRSDAAIHVATLERLTTFDCLAIPKVLRVCQRHGLVVLETVYETSAPYQGGRGRELLAMLRALRQAGLVHTNVHPKNVRVVGDGSLKVIDLGRSLAEHTESGHEAMVRRAFLAWRFGSRDDLPVLMRRATTSDDFPELVGWRSLLEAVSEVPAKQRLDGALLELLDERAPERVLDFGAGKPRPLHAPVHGRQWTAFEPDPALKPRWQGSSAHFAGEPELDAIVASGETFDGIVCSLVLCTLADADMGLALSRMRRATARHGRVLVAVCDPTGVGGEQTTDFERRASHATYEHRSTYAKLVASSACCRSEEHRSLDAYRRAFAKAGFRIERESTVDTLDTTRLERVFEFRIFELAPLCALPCSTSLLVKVCAMEAETVREQIRHLVAQLGTPRAFDEVVVVLDPREDGFPRPYGRADLPRVRGELERLRGEGLVDRIVEGPRDGRDAEAIAARWFGMPTARAHVANGQPALGILSGLEACRGDLVLHADADVLIARPNRAADLGLDAHETFARQPDAVALSLAVCGDVDPKERSADARGPFGVDATCGWLHRARLLHLRPLPNDLHDGVLALPWHRSLDRAVRLGQVRSLRKGSRGAFFAHPDNARKADLDGHLLLIDRFESGFALAIQMGHADIQGSSSSWAGPKRCEKLVVIVTGRNVAPGRVRRCFDSLRAQSNVEWGAVVIDDASDNGAHEVISRECESLERCTPVRRRRRVGQLRNLVLAIRDIVTPPDAVIALLDMDDALGSHDALARVLAEHEGGADVTVGSMVRTDKDVRYVVDFSDPRGRRGGAVWQHLRTFRKELFDRIDLADLRDGGHWFDLANDWSFMLPIVEMARQPAWIRQPLYLHEPSGPRDDTTRARRATVLDTIVRRPSYRGRSAVPRVAVLAYHRIAEGGDPTLEPYRARGMVVSPAALQAHLRTAARHFEPVRLSDVEAAYRGKRSLPERAILVTIDDGYADLEVALPVCSRMGFPVGLFARAASADGRPSWAPLDLLYHARARRPGGPRVDQGSRAAFLRWTLSDQLGSAMAEARGSATPEEIRAWWEALYLSEGRLREVLGPDVELGAHGVEHVPWTTLDERCLRAELARSWQWMERFGAAATRAVAYPDGQVDECVENVARQAGASVGFAIGENGGRHGFTVRRYVPGDAEDWMGNLVNAIQTEATS